MLRKELRSTQIWCI